MNKQKRCPLSKIPYKEKNQLIVANLQQPAGFFAEDLRYFKTSLLD